MRLGRFGGAAAAAGGAAVLLLLGLLAPGTHGTFSATITGTTGAVLNPWFGCHAVGAGSGAQPVFAYGLDDGEGAVAAVDLAGTGRDGTYSAGVHVEADPTAPCRRDGTTVWLPGGTTDLVSPSVTLPTNFAYETWFRTAQPNRVLMSIELRGYGSVVLAVDPDGGVVLGGLGQEYLRARGSVADGRWHHLVVDAGNGTLAFWVDGALIASDSLNVPDGLSVFIHVGSGSASSPASVSGAQPFDGRLRFAALYARVLRPDEIAQHLAAGLAGPDPSTASRSTATSSSTPPPTASASAVVPQGSAGAGG